MYLDRYGLPTQENGDGNDCLQRVGMILTADALNDKVPASNLLFGLALRLQPSPGIFTRYVGGNTNNVSADQLVSALCASLAWNLHEIVLAMFVRMALRLGFAQNYVDGLNDDPRWKLPDFMLLRTMPLFARASWAFYPIAYMFDLYLLVMVLGDWIYLKTDKDPADINNTLMTVVLCREIKPTPISWLAYKIWPKLRPGIYSWLERYHRPESGGNIEIAQMWKPICDKLQG
jgi:hypothetical protein